MTRARLALTAAGILALDEMDGLIVFSKHAAEPKEVASRLRVLQEERKPTPELRRVIDQLIQRGATSLEVDVALLDAVREAVSGRDVELILETPRPIDFEGILEQSGLMGREEYRSILRAVSDELAQMRLRRAGERRDLHIVHAVHVLDDLEKHLNQIYTRAREWYGVHYPELADLLQDPVDYLRFVSSVPTRQDVDVGTVERVIGSHKRLDDIIASAHASLGASITSEDAKTISMLTSLGVQTQHVKSKLEDYIRSMMSSEAPNLSAIAGPVLGSRLIALANGLERLARMPSSTIQVLGAEKALFRFFRTGRGAPKHGIIFQHPSIHSANRWQRGKIARAMAAKISIAARVDFFSKEDRSAELKRALEQRIEEIISKTPEPPPAKQRRREAPTERRRSREGRG